MFRLAFVSVLPLVLAGGTAPAWLSSAPHPCIVTNDTTVEMASLPWQGDIRIAFTSSAARATVRVQQVDDPDLADLVVADDAGTTDEGSCSTVGTPRFVAIDDQIRSGEPVIFLSDEGNTDYRVFVHSSGFSARQAAALVVGAHMKPLHLVVSARGE